MAKNQSGTGQPGSNKSPGGGPGGPRKKKKPGKNDGLSPFFGGYRKMGLPVGLARRLVNSQMHDALRDIRREGRQARRSSRNESNRVKSQYRKSVGDINHVFGESREYMDQQNKLIADRHAANSGQAAAAQAALMQQLGANTQQNAAGATSELERLGINAPNTLGQFAADAANASNLAQVSGSNVQANLAAMASGDASIGDLLKGMNEGSRISQLGNVRNERDLALSDVRQRRLDAQMQVREAMQETLGQRGDMVLELLEQLRSTGWQRFMGGGKNGRNGGRSNNGGRYNYSDYSNNSGGSNYQSGGGNSGGGSEYPDWGTLGNVRLDGLENLYGKRNR